MKRFLFLVIQILPRYTHILTRQLREEILILGVEFYSNGKLSRADLETPTAYNTYTITGLPPGAIATPGADSLKAAAHPAKTPYLYFVADGKGGHTFNTNLASHNKSVQDYLKVLKEKNAQ